MQGPIRWTLPYHEAINAEHEPMIRKFDAMTALLLVDLQRGVDVLEHWGGAKGRRNNPQAETNLRSLLEAWRSHGLPVYYTVHDSREARSPLKLSLPTGRIIEGLEPRAGEHVMRMYRDHRRVS